MPFVAWMDIQMHWNIILQHVHKSTCQDITLKKPDSQLWPSIHNNTTVPLSCCLAALLKNWHSSLDDQVLLSPFLCISTCLSGIGFPLPVMFCLTKAAGRVEQILEEEKKTKTT